MTYFVHCLLCEVVATPRLRPESAQHRSGLQIDQVDHARLGGATEGISENGWKLEKCEDIATKHIAACCIVHCVQDGQPKTFNKGGLTWCAMGMSYMLYAKHVRVACPMFAESWCRCESDISRGLCKVYMFESQVFSKWLLGLATNCGQLHWANLAPWSGVSEIFHQMTCPRDLLSRLKEMGVKNYQELKGFETRK